jgi:hypothetical protein
MNAPAKKARRDYGKDANGAKNPGVTTVLGEHLGWSKVGLMFWSARTAAQAAVQDMLAGGNPDEVVERARKAHVKIRDTAADAGTRAHEYAEKYIRDGVPVPADDPFEDEEERRARRAAAKVAKWWDASGLFCHAAELPLIDNELGFGGTIDLVVVDAHGDFWLVDLKTGKSVYDEVVLQLGAYSALLSKHGKQVKGAFVVHANGEDDKPASIVPIGPRMLTMGATGFVNLLWLHKNRKDFKLDLDNLGGTP